MIRVLEKEGVLKKCRAKLPAPEEEMGEVRATVKLTNTLDEDRFAEGERTRDEIREFDGDALVDTGAVHSVLPLAVVEKLGVRIRGQAVAEYGDGRHETVGLTAPVTFELLGRSTTDEALVLGDEILIGQTVLEKLDLLPDCRGRRLIPNPEHPDQPVSKVKRLIVLN